VLKLATVGPRLQSRSAPSRRTVRLSFSGVWCYTYSLALFTILLATSAVDDTSPKHKLFLAVWAQLYVEHRHAASTPEQPCTQWAAISNPAHLAGCESTNFLPHGVLLVQRGPQHSLSALQELAGRGSPCNSQSYLATLATKGHSYLQL
jgi:hypothetical protein